MNATRSTFIARLAVVVALVFVAGCGKSTMTPIKMLDPTVKPYRAIRVSVESKVAEDVSKEVSDLQGEIVSELRDTKRFGDVALAGANDTTQALLVRANVVGVRKVGGGSRFFLGAFAGKASLSTDVEFVDTATGEVLGSYGIKEQTGSTGYSGTTSETVRKTAKRIAKLSTEHFSVAVMTNR